MFKIGWLPIESNCGFLSSLAGPREGIRHVFSKVEFKCPLAKGSPTMVQTFNYRITNGLDGYGQI